MNIQWCDETKRMERENRKDKIKHFCFESYTIISISGLSFFIDLEGSAGERRWL